MPDGGWAKAAAMMSPEKLAEAKEAVDLWKAQKELKEQGLLPEDDEEGEEGEGEEEDAWEKWLDGMITKFGAAMAVLMGVVAVVVMIVRPAMGYGMGEAERRDLDMDGGQGSGAREGVY